MTKRKSRIVNPPDEALFDELSKLIEQSRRKVSFAANSALTLLFWQLGKRINEHILKNKRAEYGREIVSTVSTQLKLKYGKNFEERNLRRMMQFAEQFTDDKIIIFLSKQLSWSHFVELLPIRNKNAKLFYAQKSVSEGWNIRELREQISSKTFERTEIVNTQLNINVKFPVNTFKAPYILDFLGLRDGYLENNLEAAILRELDHSILEIGKGFAFVERQKRMIVDGEDHHLDLLFYHRKLKRLVAIDLKIGKFQPRIKDRWNFT